MTLHLAQWTFEASSGLSEDRVVNTFFFDSVNPVATDYDNVRDLLLDFYNDDSVSSNAVASYLSEFLHVSTNTLEYTLKMYNMEDATPRLPVYEDTDTFNRTAASANRLPNEVAAVVSFESPAASGIPHLRRRNSIYLGPLNTGAVILSGAGAGLLSTAFTAVCVASGGRLIDAAEASASWRFVTASLNARDNSFSDQPWASRPILEPYIAEVTAGWFDNAPDTQRRRGVRPTARNGFDASDAP